MARENRLTIKSLTKPRNVYEASGSRLDIIGTADMWVKIAAINKMKKLRCLILRGSGVDREVLISCKMLKKWDLIHPSFPHETVDNFVKENSNYRKQLQCSISHQFRPTTESARFHWNAKCYAKIF